MKLPLIGKCDSCGKIRSLLAQTNFNVRRHMCAPCCKAANEVESMIGLPAHERHVTRATLQTMIIPSNWLEKYVNGEWDGES